MDCSKQTDNSIHQQSITKIVVYKKILAAGVGKVYGVFEDGIGLGMYGRNKIHSKTIVASGYLIYRYPLIGVSHLGRQKTIEMQR